MGNTRTRDPRLPPPPPAPSKPVLGAYLPDMKAPREGAHLLQHFVFVLTMKSRGAWANHSQNVAAPADTKARAGAHQLQV